MTPALEHRLGTSPTFDLYLHQIQEDSLLTAAEECELARAIAAGDEDARRRMIQANLRLVVKIARDYVGRGLPLDDLVGEGNIGLIRATKDYDPGFNTRFSTYAAYWIKQAIRHALTTTSTTIRLPAHMVGLLYKWRREERTLRKELGYRPEPSLVADRLGLTAAQQVMVARAIRARRLRQESSVDPETNWTPDQTADPHEGPESRLEEDESRREVLDRLDRLDTRERLVIVLRFGLGGQIPMTLKEVGRKLGVTREWVRKIEQRAVRKMGAWPAECPGATMRQDGSQRSPARRRVLSA